MGSKKNVTVDGSQDQVKVVAEAAPEVAEVTEAEGAETKKTPKVSKKEARSTRYRVKRALVDRNKFYPMAEALELVKKLHYANFVGTVSADLVLKEAGGQIKVNLPHAAGKALRIAVVDDALLAEIEAGKIEFDVLLTTPQFMPKLAKLARVLGPKGLMPNPKNGTITNDPEKAKAELLGGKTILKPEKKAPLLHVTLGKTDWTSGDLGDNLAVILKAADTQVVKVVVSSTMSPGVKVAL